MITTNKSGLKTFTLLGLFSLIFPFYILISWIIAANSGNGIEDSKALFVASLPAFIRQSQTISLLSIIFCLIAILFGYFARKITSNFWNKLNLLIVVLGSIILLLNLFWLM